MTRPALVLAAVMAAMSAAPAAAQSNRCGFQEICDIAWNRPGPKLAAVAKAYVVASDSKTTRVAIACAAQGTEAFASVAITACYTTNGATAPLVSLPGLTAATAGAGNATAASYNVCVEAKARTVVGSREVVASLRCEPSVLGVGLSQTTA